MSSIFLNGYRDNGQDNTQQYFNGLNDLTVSGVAGNAILGAGYVFVNYSGTAPVRVVVPANYALSNKAFTVADSFGGAAGQNIIVSGAVPVSGPQATFNGASTYTINTAFGVTNFILASGVNWLAK